MIDAIGLALTDGHVDPTPGRVRLPLDGSNFVRGCAAGQHVIKTIAAAGFMNFVAFRKLVLRRARQCCP
jgi:hypothetical protein